MHPASYLFALSIFQIMIEYPMAHLDQLEMKKYIKNVLIMKIQINCFFKCRT